LKFTLAAIYASLNLPLWQMKLTPGVNFPQVRIHCSSLLLHVGGSYQMVVGAWDRNSNLSRQLPGWLSSPIQDPHCSPQQE